MASVTGLLQLPRMWFAVGAMLVASIAGGVTALIVHSDNRAGHANVLGEKVTGSGSRTVAPSSSGVGNGHCNNGNGNGNGNAGSSSNNTSPGQSFTISGSADGLFPGALTKLYLTVTNPNNQ